MILKNFYCASNNFFSLISYIQGHIYDFSLLFACAKYAILKIQWSTCVSVNLANYCDIK
jgi:hypothetical protein